MEGFFTAKEAQSKSRPDGKTYSCASCGLYKTAHSPRMKPYGNFAKGIMNISILSKVDDKVGKPWQDEAGRFLKKRFAEFGVDLFEDCINVNAVNCYCQEPGNYEVSCCRKEVLRLIEEYQPKVVFLFGLEAVTSVIGTRWKRDLGGIMKWRGWTIPDQDLKCWICPTLHPKEIQDSELHYHTIFNRDLQNALEKLEEKFPRYKSPNITILDEDLTPLQGITSGLVAFDYETTGLKPHAPGHRIICASVAYSPTDVYVFMMPKTKEQRKPFINLLTNPRVGKIAQNMKFETHWTKIRLGVDVSPWDFDTMLASHVLDNRKDITGLKFQTYVQFGVIDYSSEIEPYLKAKDDKNANAINRIQELLDKPEGRKKLLHYCAMDSIFEYRLAQLQIAKVDHSFLPF